LPRSRRTLRFLLLVQPCSELEDIGIGVAERGGPQSSIERGCPLAPRSGLRKRLLLPPSKALIQPADLPRVLGKLPTRVSQLNAPKFRVAAPRPTRRAYRLMRSASSARRPR
jgi:hypothetical protein